MVVVTVVRITVLISLCEVEVMVVGMEEMIDLFSIDILCGVRVNGWRRLGCS